MPCLNCQTGDRNGSPVLQGLRTFPLIPIFLAFSSLSWGSRIQINPEVDREPLQSKLIM
jgi:hypothetical protein